MVRWEGQFQRSVHGPGHDGRCLLTTPTVGVLQDARFAVSLPERDEISVALIQDRTVSWAVIGRRVGRHPTTIAREVCAAGGRDRYRPAVADRDAHRRLSRPRERVLATPGVLHERVDRELRQGRSPEAIWADHVAEGLPVPCVESIYTAVYAGVFSVKPTECLRMRRPRRKRRQERHSSRRPALSNIAARPQAVNDHTVIGHWEANMIVGARNRSAMLWLTERVTRFSIPVTMPEGYNAAATLAGLIEAHEQIPAHLRLSITFDQGSEWANWETLVLTYTLACWFCDPHSPWQRGQIENLNRQWRRWFPRGTRLDLIDPAHAQQAANTINNQRRRSLAYQSPTMLYSAATAQ